MMVCCYRSMMCAIFLIMATRYLTQVAKEFFFSRSMAGGPVFGLIYSLRFHVTIKLCYYYRVVNRYQVIRRV